MTLAERYNAKEVEPRLQKWWAEKGFFRFDPESRKPVFSIDTPPRYTSGPIHIGHATSYSHQDFIARYKRMQGFNVFYPLCFDVNGMPIEVNVEKTGVTPENVGRDAFIRACSEFAKKNIDTMTKQFRELGQTMDDTIYYQTDAESYRRLTQISFIMLYERGLVYKAEVPVTWCPRCVTAIAEAEIEYETRNTKLNHIKFYLTESVKGFDTDTRGSYVVIATTRPELLSACVLVAVNPDDARYKMLVGQELVVPLYDKKVKVVADAAVKPEFGTGVVMICTIGDKNDYEWVLKHSLPLVKAIDEHGRMTDAAGKYRGMTITDARKAVINDLNEAGLLVKQEDLKQNVGTCWRCHTPIEYIATKEWFLKMLPFKEKVLTASSSLRWFPEYMQKRLIDWVNSLSWDWCISRRRYLATPVPVWECEECGDIIVAKPEQCYVEPLKAKPPRKCRCGKMPKGTELVFDTWMDSSLTPLYNCGWQRDPKLFKKLWPMTLRPQAHDIIRTWAYYTILRSVLLTDSAPFRDIMISGYIMGPDGKPMHASRGNVVNPLDVLAKYNADTFRYFASLCDLGVDTPFRWADVEHGARLLTKLWNVGRFVSAKITKPGKRPVLASADAWLLSKLQSLVHESTAALDNYNFTKAMRDLEAFFWTTFCDNYLEIVKQRFYVDDASAKWTLYYSFLTIIKLFAPFLPHITEELYQKLFKAYENYESIHLSEWPKPEKTLIDKKAEAAGDAAVAIISAVRTWKHDQKMPLNAPLKQLIVEADDKMQNALRPFLTDIAATTKAEKIEFGVGKIEAGAGLKFTAII